MAAQKWTKYILVYAAFSLGFTAADTTPSFNDPRKISITDWIRIITHPTTRDTESPALLYDIGGIFDDDLGSNESVVATEATAVLAGNSSINDANDSNAILTSSSQVFDNDTVSSANSTRSPGRSPVESTITAGVTTKAPSSVTTASSSMSAAAADFARMLELLQRAGALLPEVRDAVMRGQPLTPAQTKTVTGLVKRFGDTLSSLPDTLQSVNSTRDLIQVLSESGLLQTLRNISFPAGDGVSRVPGASSQPHTVHWLKCNADLLAMATALGSGQMWALQMLDSWGKPESSIMRGNTQFLGNNAECRNVHHTNTTTFTDVQGNMCRMNIYLESFRSPLLGGEIMPITIDACLPRSCESVDLNSALTDSGLPFVTATCTADLDIGDDPWTIVAVIVLSIFLALMVAGTLTEFCIESKPRCKPDFINAFLSSSSNADLVRNDLNGITGNGKMVPGATSLPEQHETTFGEDNEIKNAKTLNGDYTDHLPSHYPYAIVRNGNGDIAGKHNGDVSGPTRQPTLIKTVGDHNESRKSPRADETGDLPKWQRLLLAFSLPRNTGKILGVKAGPGSIACLHGIRVLSMGWVIFGHTFSFAGQFRNFQNNLDIFDLIQDFTFQIQANGTLSVDSFFFMSGLLTAYMFLKECGKQEKVTIKQGIMYYVHRYWRLTPPMMIWIMVVACIMQYVGEGRPGWVDYPGAQLCRDNWYVNLLYIQNLWEEKAGCIGVTWYLANDMQFYFLAPLVLIPWVYRKQILGIALAIALVVVHITSNAWLVYEYNFDVLRQGKNGEYMTKLYVKPWARVGPFAIGLIVGYILWKTKCKLHINKYLVAIGWFLAMAAMFTVTLVTYDENKDPINDPDGWPVGGKLVHETFSRPVWALVLSWIVLTCATGHGGFINSILSWEGFLPLSRMTYCAYLVHLSIMGYEFMAADSTFLYTMTNLIYRFFGMYVMSYAVAFLLAVGVEAPMLGLEKVALAR